MPAIPPRFDITHEEIDRVVTDFYAAVRQHPGLGPVFATHVRAGMFDPWLGLFDSVLKRNLAPETAAQWSALAHRIGQGMRYAVVEPTKDSDGVPKLR
jgi:hemoglobin